MKKAVLRLIAAATLTMWSLVMYLIIDLTRPDDITLPTLAVLPTYQPPVETTDVQYTPQLETTSTATPKPQVSPTAASTITPTLDIHVLEIVAVMPDVNLSSTATAYPPNATLIPAPPNPSEPLPDATRLPPPYFDWYSFESDHPSVSYATRWEPRLHPQASRGQYHRTEDISSSVRFAFEGEALRIRYVAARNMGIFQVIVDGNVIDTVDGYHPDLAFLATRVYTLLSGQHLLELRNVGSKNDLSDGFTVGLDAIQVWRASPQTLIIAPMVIQTPTTPPEAAQIELISAPTTVQPTTTPIPPQVINAVVLIAYDENRNQTIDPAEGVSGVSVRVVDTNTNRVITSGLTDASGYVALELVSDSSAQIVVPYFGESWQLQRDRMSTSAYTFLLTPGNQPGLIP